MTLFSFIKTNSMIKKFTIVLSAVLLLGVSAFSQQRSVSGVVKSADDGLPIPGATVLVKGTLSEPQLTLTGPISLRMCRLELPLFFHSSV